MAFFKEIRHYFSIFFGFMREFLVALNTRFTGIIEKGLYTKGEPFLSKRIRGGGKVGGPSLYNTLLSAPQAHWAIITSRREKLCVLLLLVIITFYAFSFFSYSIGMHPFSLHLSPLSALLRSFLM